MLPPCGTSVTVVVVNDEAFIASENVAVVLTVKAWPTAPFDGVTVVAVGGVPSGTRVVKLQTLSVARGFPARSVAPVAPPLTVAL